MWPAWASAELAIWRRRRVWLTGVVAFVIFFCLAFSVRIGWSTVGDALTFLAVVAAGITIYYASQSVQAARDTVEPLRQMATNLTQAAETLEDMNTGLTATATSMQANLIMAERGRRESRLVERLEQYMRVYAAADMMQRALNRPAMVDRVEEMHQGQAALRAALTLIPDEELPLCRKASDAALSQGVPLGGVTNARLEIEQVLRDRRGELDALLRWTPSQT